MRDKDQLVPARGAIVVAQTYSYSASKDAKYWLTVSFDQNDPKHLVQGVSFWYQNKPADNPQVIMQK
jgi:hypothetical protein